MAYQAKLREGNLLYSPANRVYGLVARPIRDADGAMFVFAQMPKKGRQRPKRPRVKAR